MSIKRGQHVVSRGTYQTRGFRLAPDEVLPEDSQEFQTAAHAPRLIQIMKGDRLPAVMSGRDGQLFVRINRDGDSYACALLADSFDVA